MQAGTSTSVLDLLDIPGIADLSEQQVRGAACVWCEAPLTSDTAVDLGERRVSLLDSHITTFPRACRDCAAPRLYRALLDHTQRCEQCADDQSQCETGTALRDAVREARG
ncbi:MULTISPECIES: hypothetical protein [unclassified Streptomyces]|uniref:hypothetical protein n=1 Tax=unclassified Streptomyces TaxID=2593676 RepID=UPI00116399E0|nr:MULTISPECIES: hypothetical protein [unclassified Streptomyces]NMI57113.1 hypothetical protein [Streptomyces sp. RLA2-12]QDN56492.1 hypothetical protein FNV67_15360 [Streptomyces sp. S1D4-20]QDN66669.1 hypothetical protein FNV66_14955 [Streptomyces sp. S1D4-14]QDO49076.1 hypothetical protein FNV60_13205 [Streptomyces sp. RLB3-5]QDO59317.1 hypothetical protein FNV59_15450 [Streptomyces sp. RLB1-8]